ncbi:winged helix-turn-helix domain-containing protein [Streptomyces bobili]|uniref:winged helix-turn-helix domain-containing protein n=1 Tax=Streptomyces bobili TaxID=67280 RepID=UPI003F4CE85A
MSLSIRGLRRQGWSCQQPARRAVERDEAAVAGWVKESWPGAKPPRRRLGHGWSSRTKPLSRDAVAPRTHLGTQREHARGSAQWRFPRPHVDGRTGVLQGRRTQPSDLPSRIQGHHRGAQRGFTWQDYRDLLVRAHLQLGGPVVVIWDNLKVHLQSIT